jgi:magnesium transporter
MTAETTETRDAWVEMRSLIEAKDSQALVAYLDALPAGEIGRLLSRLSDEEVALLMELIGPEEGAELLGIISEAQAVDIIEELPVESAAKIVDELDSDEQADILGELDREDAEAILSQMDPEEASAARSLINYEWSTAGGIMITEFLAFNERTTTLNLLEDLRRNRDVYADYDVGYIYITDSEKRLKGVLKLRELILSKDNVRVGSLMTRNPIKVKTDESLVSLREIFEGYDLLGIPVVERHGRLVGVVRRAAVEEAVGEQATEDFLKMSGISGGEELRSMPFWERSQGRLQWLVVGLFLSIAASSVIAAFEDVISRVILLAAFLPVVANISGASGNQAVAVSIRELTLGLVKPWELMRVLLKEVGVGALNGLMLGILFGSVVAVWKGNAALGLVVGAAMLFNCTISVIVGGCIPLVLKLIRQDPALASGPFVTTTSDATGFFVTLLLASAMMKYLAV